ncbi:hypothetical protein TNCV_883791 [Trichonephila clavipes]|nr:hypothetical protein TNCV_883791 [Trichonephila clavipes]
MSGYRELYKELVPSQSLITDYLVKEKKITEVFEEALPCRSDDVILSSSDESDLAPIHKRIEFSRSDGLMQRLSVSSYGTTPSVCIVCMKRFIPDLVKSECLSKYPDSDEDVRLNESDCEESEESADVIDNISVNSDIYVAKDGIEGIPHNSNVPGRFAT